jgi:hypothetical protein
MISEQSPFWRRFTSPRYLVRKIRERGVFGLPGWFLGKILDQAESSTVSEENKLEPGASADAPIIALESLPFGNL